MRVLHLPTNIASQLSVTVRALGRLGIEARGLVLNNRPSCDDRTIENHVVPSLRRQPIRGLLARADWYRAIREAVDWVDVIHWHYGETTLPLGLDLRCVARSGKARLVEFWGTDVRVPEIASRDNPTLARMYAEHPELARGRAAASRRAQRRFAAAGFACLLPGPDLAPHVLEGLFPSVHACRARVMLEDFEPAYPEPDATEPLVVHAPSHYARKGTDAILAAVERLRRTRAFRFELIHGRSRPESLAAIRRCDVFLDQFVIGAYGLAAVEAMALGKPCIAYLTESIRRVYPPELPIVVASPETLSCVLAALLDDGPRRLALGRQGRAYAESYHDATRVAGQLAEIYERLLGRGRTGPLSPWEKVRVRADRDGSSLAPSPPAPLPQAGEGRSFMPLPRAGEGISSTALPQAGERSVSEVRPAEVSLTRSFSILPRDPAAKPCA